MGKRVLVYGGRDFDDTLAMQSMLEIWVIPGDVVVHGGAPGADSLAGDIAGRILGLQVEVHPADWAKYGKAAGPIRNQEMLDSGIDFALQFPGGKGTADMRRRLDKAGVSVAEAEQDVAL
jgi:hypothetical protein